MVVLSKTNKLIEILITSIFILLFIFSPAHSQQNENFSMLMDKLSRLERSIQEISRIVYSEKGVQKQELFGENSNAKNSSVTSKQLVANEIRMSDIETELRSLTGSVEQAVREVSLMRDRLDKLVEDVDLRLTSVEKEILSIGSSESQIKLNNQDAEMSNTSTSSVKNNESDLEKIDSTAKENSKSVLPEANAEEQYAFARGLLMKLDYSAAEEAFKSFIELNSNHSLASNAYYWLGETFYVRKIYSEAAGAFIDSYKFFPQGNKAADSLLKLGMSLAILGSKEEACETFEELLLKFSDENVRLRRKALQEAVKTGCKS
tara:strand:+ start:583 stop:1539 length:957 start_codon:yes stop_codon:yes gene_type:complete